MKNHILSIFLLISTINFSQKKISKQFITSAIEINIYTAGLDNLVLENSNSDFVEVLLIAENYDEQLIKIENNAKESKIAFAFEGTETREVSFRKYITKRLQRANATVKIPKGKKVFVFGENVDIDSKDLKSDIAIYIENGIVKLNKIKSKTTLKLYSGNVYAKVNKVNLDIKSNEGKIMVNDNFYQKTHLHKLLENKNDLNIKTIKANIILTSK